MSAVRQLVQALLLLRFEIATILIAARCERETANGSEGKFRKAAAQDSAQMLILTAHRELETEDRN